jgi:multisubunit Na+/H+ antiporter MnhB subunit
VASIALQNLIWAAVALFLFSHYKDKKKFEWPKGFLSVATLVFLCVFIAILVWGMTEFTFSHQFMNVQFFLLGLQLGFWRTGNISAKV